MKSRFSSDQPAGTRWFETGLQKFACKDNGKDKLWHNFTILLTSFTLKQNTTFIFLQGR
jgi:hypothetical protein